jgi:hypothetical protein
MSDQLQPKSQGFSKEHMWWIGGAAAAVLLSSCACCGVVMIFINLPGINVLRMEAGKPLGKIEPAKAEQVEMTLAAYLIQRPDVPTKITSECKLLNHYNGAYQNTAATHHSVRLFSQTPLKSGYAWVPKDSEVGRDVFDILKAGGQRTLTLEVVLRGPDGTPTPPGRQEMAIVRVVK